jgi:hypothetical protein
MAEDAVALPSGDLLEDAQVLQLLDELVRGHESDPEAVLHHIHVDKGQWPLSTGGGEVPPTGIEPVHAA